MIDNPAFTRKTDVVAALRRLAAPVPAKQDNALPRYEIELELRRHHQAFEDEREARHQAKQEAANVPRNPVDALRAALAGSGSGHMALNSAELLRAALGGSGGSINGEVIQ